MRSVNRFSFGKLVFVVCSIATFEGDATTAAFLPTSTVGTAESNHGVSFQNVHARSSSLKMHQSLSRLSNENIELMDIVSERLELTRQQKHPTNEEQLRLLTDAVELRRLKQVESEQLAKMGKSFLPALIICRAAGYDENLEAYETALEVGRKARESLITRNMGLVYFVVKDIVGTPKRMKRTLQSLSIDDLIQEGAIGLSRAVDRWNPEIGGRFSTYAVYWIRAAVLRCIAERDDLVRVPVHVTSAINKVATVTRQLGLAADMLVSGGMGYEDDWHLLGTSKDGSSWEEAKDARALAEAAGLSEKQFARALEVQRRRQRGGISSFETWMQQGKDLSSDHAALYVSSSSSSIDLEHLRNELAKFLRPKEVEALSWRYGLTSHSVAAVDGRIDDASKTVVATRGKWGEAMTFQEVGKRMHISAEYGRRLCQKALSKLRLAHEQGRLEPSFLAI
ncbi:hypothetical protein ACA910_021064 [Epithemia clementina (nom. ined.)]